MEPIRILQVVTHMNRGGAETMLMNYYRNIDRTKIQFDFLAHRSEPKAYDDEIRALGGRIYHLSPVDPFGFNGYKKELKKFFAEHKEYKIVHAHLDTLSTYVLNVAKEAGVTVRIAHSHNTKMDFDFKFPIRLYSKLKLKKTANQYFACGKDAGKWLFGSKEIDNVTILNNAIDVKGYKYDQQKALEVKRSLNIEDKFVIGHIGRFYKQKNHEFLIDIFYEVYKKNKQSVLLLVGDGVLKPQIIEKVSKLNLSENVKFLGVRSDVADLVQAFDVFLFPSLYEGLPVTLIEAQAAGLKCIVSDCITNECDLTGNMKFLNLKDSPEKWAEKVLSEYEGFVKTDTSEFIKRGGFDVRENVKWLEEFYLTEWRK